jgi:hypothetical protein
VGAAENAGASGKTGDGDMPNEWILELIPATLGLPVIVVIVVLHSAITAF